MDGHRASPRRGLLVASVVASLVGLGLSAPAALATPAAGEGGRPSAPAGPVPDEGVVRPVHGAPVVDRPEPGVLRSQRVALDPELLPSTEAEAASGVALPLFPDTELVVDLEPSQLSTTGYQSWRGTVRGSTDSSVVLVEREGVLNGWVADDSGAAYRLRPDGQGGTVSEQVDPAAFPQDRLEPGPPPPAGAPLAEPRPVPDGTEAVVDVLVAYTPAARAARGGTAAIETELALAVEQADAALSDSGVAASFRLVKLAEVPHDGDADGTSLSRLTGTADGWNDEVHALRDAYAADLVALVVDDTAGQYCGIAWLMNPVRVGFATHAMSVTDVHCATGNLTLTHEMGHNLGAAHDRGAWSGTPPYSYGYDWVNPTARWRTVMSYANACSGCARLARFSNPDQLHGGARMGSPIGQPDEADNRALLNLTTPVAAAFRGAPATATVAVTAPVPGTVARAPGTVQVGWASSGNVGPSVRIELLRGSEVVQVLAAAAPSGPRAWSWPVSGDLPHGDDYRIRVTSTALPSVTASSGTFEVAAPALAVTSQPTAQTWQPGAPQVLSWSYLGSPTGAVRLELVREGRVAVVVSPGAPLGSGGSGSFTWTPPAGLGRYDGYRVRASLTAVPEVVAHSAGAVSYAGTAAVRLTTDHSGATWVAGTSRTIRWTSEGAVGSKVRIELLRGTDVAAVVSTGVPVATGSFSWTAPARLGSAADYRVRVVAVGLPLLSDSSDQPFPVDGTSVSLHDTSGTALVAGTRVELTWTRTGSPGTALKLELVPATGRPLVVAGSAQLTAGRYTWTSPVTVPPGTGYRFRATVAGNPLVRDVSDTSTVVTRPSLALTTPERLTWTTGSKQRVEWRFSDGAAAPVTLELVRGSEVLTVVKGARTALGEGRGAYDWTVPVGLAPGSGWSLRVSAAALPELRATGAFAVELARPVLTVSAATTPGPWVAGRPVTVAWQASGGAAFPVHVRLLRDGATVAVASSRPTAADGSGKVVWTPPVTLAPASDWTLRVEAASAPQVQGARSDLVLTRPALTVTGPGPGTVLRAGSPVDVTWAVSDGAALPVDVLLVGADGAAVRLATARPTSAVTSTGSWRWTPPRTLAVASGWRLRVATVGGAVSATSAGTYSSSA